MRGPKPRWWGTSLILGMLLWMSRAMDLADLGNFISLGWISVPWEIVVQIIQYGGLVVGGALLGTQVELLMRRNAIRNIRIRRFQDLVDTGFMCDRYMVSLLASGETISIDRRKYGFSYQAAWDLLEQIGDIDRRFHPDEVIEFPPTPENEPSGRMNSLSHIALHSTKELRVRLPKEFVRPAKTMIKRWAEKDGFVYPPI